MALTASSSPGAQWGRRDHRTGYSQWTTAHDSRHPGLHFQERSSEGGRYPVLSRCHRCRHNGENPQCPGLSPSGKQGSHSCLCPKQQSELFKQLFKKLSQPQLSVFISGPTPTCGRGVGRFSRLLSMNTCLSSACTLHNVGFIDNFDVFWQRRLLFGSDGLHLNRAGARVLSANLVYDVQHARRRLFPRHCTPAPTDLPVTE